MLSVQYENIYLFLLFFQYEIPQIPTSHNVRHSLNLENLSLHDTTWEDSEIIRDSPVLRKIDQHAEVYLNAEELYPSHILNSQCNKSQHATTSRGRDLYAKNGGSLAKCASSSGAKSSEDKTTNGFTKPVVTSSNGGGGGFLQNTYNSTDSSGYNSSSTIDAIDHARNHLPPGGKLHSSDTLNSNSSNVSKGTTGSMVSTDRGCSMGGHIPASEFVPWKINSSETGVRKTGTEVQKTIEALRKAQNAAADSSNCVWQKRRPSREQKIDLIKPIAADDAPQSKIERVTLDQCQKSSFKIIPIPHMSTNVSPNYPKEKPPIPAPRAKYPSMMSARSEVPRVPPHKPMMAHPLNENLPLVADKSPRHVIVNKVSPVHIQNKDSNCRLSNSDDSTYREYIASKTIYIALLSQLSLNCISVIYTVRW